MERGVKMFFSPHQISLLHKNQTEVPMCLKTPRIQPQDGFKPNLRSGKLFLRAKAQPKKLLRLFAIRILIDCRLKMKLKQRFIRFTLIAQAGRARGCYAAPSRSRLTATVFSNCRFK